MNYEALEKLVELKEKGILSEEEFQTEKKKLLSPTNEVSENNISIQEINTPQAVEQNNYNPNLVSQESKIKGSPEKTVFLVILIPVIVIGMIWFFNREDNAPNGYSSYSPSTSSYNTTTSNDSNSATTNTTKSPSNTSSTAITNTTKPANTSSNTTSVSNTQNTTTTQSVSNASSSANATTKTTGTTKEKYGTATERAKLLWGEGKEQYGSELLYNAMHYYFWATLNPDRTEEVIKERDKYLKNNTSLELAQIYLFNRILSEGEIDLEDTDYKKIWQQVSERASQLGRAFEEDSEDDATNFYLLAYGYAVLANEGKDLDKVFEQLFNEKITPKDAKELFDLFTQSRDVTRSENIPNNDPSYK